MRLFTAGNFSLVSPSKDKVPPYAILSHTWCRGEDDEVTFRGIIDVVGDKKNGFLKLHFCNGQAAADNLRYFWVDTWCIDKLNAKELRTAINSMFK